MTAEESRLLRQQAKELVWTVLTTAMEDDFNTADAISAVFELVKLANSGTVGETSSKALVYRICKRSS